MYYRDARREIASPGLRAAAIERVDVRGEHAGICKEIAPPSAVQMGHRHGDQAEAHPRLHGGSLIRHCKLRGCRSLQLRNSVSHRAPIRRSRHHPVKSYGPRREVAGQCRRQSVLWGRRHCQSMRQTMVRYSVGTH